MPSLAFFVAVVGCTIVVANVLWLPAESYHIDKYSLLMPNVRPKKMDKYLCTSIKINFNSSHYITGFEPKAQEHTVHHMLLFGCSEPGSENPVWNCGEMEASRKQNSGSMHFPPCKSEFNIIYAWAHNAPMLNLPKNVGFEVGGDSNINYLVLQVHYHRLFDNDEIDNSGVILNFTEQQLKKHAGVYLLATDGRILKHSIEHMEASCRFTEPGKVIHPFAYRVHTHSLGKVVAGYRVKSLANGQQKWDQLGKRDPLTPQMFYPIESNITIEFGDILAFRCTMESKRNTLTKIGFTSDDEMCNFYVMYWMEGKEPLKNRICLSQGPPNYYWFRDLDLSNIPDIEASIL